MQYALYRVLGTYHSINNSDMIGYFLKLLTLRRNQSLNTMKVHRISFKTLLVIGIICIITSLTIMGVFHLIYGLPFLFLGLIWIILAIETKTGKKLEV